LVFGRAGFGADRRTCAGGKKRARSAQGQERRRCIEQCSGKGHTAVTGARHPFSVDGGGGGERFFFIARKQTPQLSC